MIFILNFWRKFHLPKTLSFVFHDLLWNLERRVYLQKASLYQSGFSPSPLSFVSVFLDSLLFWLSKRWRQFQKTFTFILFFIRILNIITLILFSIGFYDFCVLWTGFRWLYEFNMDSAYKNHYRLAFQSL